MVCFEQSVCHQGFGNPFIKCLMEVSWFQHSDVGGYRSLMVVACLLCM